MTLMVEFWVTSAVLASAAFWLALYWYVTRDFSYWKNLKVKFAQPIPFFGNILPVLLMKKSLGDVICELYRSTTDPFIGLFVCSEPCLLVRDPELVRAVLVKDFDVFDNHTMAANDKDDEMGSHILFLMRNPSWHAVRRKLSPAFNSSKAKMMYPFARQAGQDLIAYVDKQIANDPVLECKELAAMFTTDSITASAFGQKAGSFERADSKFRAVAGRTFNWDIWERGISNTCHFVAPALVKLFKMKFIDTFTSEFLREVFWKTMRERQESNAVKNDLFDVIIAMKKREKPDDPYALDGDKLVAQGAQFFIAGFDTTSSTIAIALYELAKCPDAQEKLRKEILANLNEDGELSYEAVHDMEYLEYCIKETLRLHPVVMFLDRRANRDYKIPGTETVVRKGTPVYVSTYGMSYDPQYFPEPEKFDPERFAPGNVENITPYTYLPFGGGPRTCIGARLGLLNSKTGVAHVISKFKVSMCSKTQKTLKLDPRGFILHPLGGLHLEFSRI